ncbi:HCL387Cp [Eremothecium sinecaudum]|uniref:HCL387Cp n=1 Tax=Eremothecium sinecaudum TaxID=45286 RepID=A0A109UYB5_9SACH|nr:HCL387Cp [Eremothecium sinecaudum]AMD19764.1 HCL387Cp [Eremothecium sinecaudum]
MTLDYEIYKEGGLLKERYQKLEDISEGSYGYVSLAKDSKLKKLVAVKYIFKTEDDDDDDDRFKHGKGVDDSSRNSSLEKRHLLLKRQRSLISEKVRSKLSDNVCFEALYEVDIKNKIGKHKNIAELLDYFDSYIIMEYCSGGDLYEAIRADLVPKKTKQLTHIISQIMDAVEYVHSKGIYHRDIKPENILIADSNWTIKLTDWGLATTDETSMDRNVGSERYMAPELFESNLDYDERGEPYNCSKVDIWAIGIVLLNIVFHKNPFSVANQSDKSFCYFAANREALFDVFSTMSYDFFQLLRHSLTIDPTNRYLHRMKEELGRLGEYTLDDEYHNSINDRDVASEEEDAYSAFSRFHEIDSSNTTTTPISETDSIPVTPSPVPVSAITAETHITPVPLKKESKDPIPRFTFTKRSHPKPSSEKNTKPIKIKHSRKIIKHTRKPLGIPTPNSHINNFIHEYSQDDADDFNTRNFYTPPSLHNKYMEGVFNRRNRNRRHSHNYNSNDINGNGNGRPSSANAATRSSFQSAGSYGNNGNNHNNITSNGKNGSSSMTGQNSPSSGKYVPPHSRNSISNASPNNLTNSAYVDGDSPKAGATYHEQHRLAVDTEPDVDDVLFTLEESDVDNFINDISNLSVKDHDKNSMHHARTPGNLEAISTANGNNHANGHLVTYVPDLLKSPHSPSPDLHDHLKNFNFNMSTSGRKQNNPAPEYKPKPGIYIPPHHRKSVTQVTCNNVNGSLDGVSNTLSVESENYNSGPTSKKSALNIRKPSTSGSNHNNNDYNNNDHNINISHGSNKFEAHTSKFDKPYMPRNHAVSTTALQNADVFAHTNSIMFDCTEVHHPRRTSLYTQSPSRIKSGRKSSIQDDLVGSLEQYKNNWLILQQHQD